jgi:hypothetical protein
MHHALDDERLLGELRRLFDAADPLPARVLGAARASYAWRTIDAELAALTFDSLIEPALTGVRGGGEPRLVAFAAGDVQVELEIHAAGQQRRLVGQLVPPGPAELEIQQAGGTHRRLQADRSGRFAAGGLSGEPIRLACRLPGQPPVVTEWLLP